MIFLKKQSTYLTSSRRIFLHYLHNLPLTTVLGAFKNNFPSRSIPMIRFHLNPEMHVKAKNILTQNLSLGKKSL